ncbi:MAG TPA: hypothetical protein VNY31_06135 [Solirubrobacteraceae bacterium]|jgi:hypothetical protein|nr:hypothetical protein [Solirubrobacteraceae bacterium]
MTVLTVPPIPISVLCGGDSIQLVFEGVEQGAGSFEGRVFLNNPAADAHTPLRPEVGYAGSFHVYGFGEPAPPSLRDARAAADHAIAPIEKRVLPDPAAVRRALAASDELTVTVVAVPSDPGEAVPRRPFERVSAMINPSDTR